MDKVVVYDVPDEGKKCLGRASWHFVYFERMGLVLDAYLQEERDSLRKQFRTTRLYNRLSIGRGTYAHRIEKIAEEDAPLPDWVVEQAKEQFMAGLKVGKWQRG